MSQKGPKGAAKLCVLASGGLDSALLLQRALDQGAEVYPLHIHSGFSWDDAELYWLKRVLDFLKSPCLHELYTVSHSLNSFLEKFWGFLPELAPGANSEPHTICIPGRNLFLLSHAGFYCQAKGIHEIWLGTLKGFAFPDRTPEFFHLFEDILERSFGKPILIKTPFIERTKAELIQEHPHFPYELTFTCLKPQGREPCGSCNKCEERRKSFEMVGLTIAPLPPEGRNSRPGEKKTLASVTRSP